MAHFFCAKSVLLDSKHTDPFFTVARKSDQAQLCLVQFFKIFSLFCFDFNLKAWNVKREKTKLSKLRKWEYYSDPNLK